MSDLAIKALLAGLMAALLYPPYLRWVQPRVHRLVDGGLTALLAILSVELSSALGAWLGWTSTRQRSVQELAVQSVAVLLVCILLAGFGTYYRWWLKEPVR